MGLRRRLGASQTHVSRGSDKLGVKTMKKVYIVLFVMFLACWGSKNASAEALDLSQGTWSVGGIAVLNTGVFDLGGDTEEIGTLFVSVTGGYFLLNNLELVAGLNTHRTLFGSSLHQTSISGELGLNLYFLDGSIRPYVGASVSGGGQFFDDGTVANSTSLGGAVSLGTLIGLNKHVALDLGVNIFLSYSTSSRSTSLSNNVGFIGARVFF